MTSPQTLTEIQNLLDRHGTEPNRRLGQNFLIDGNLMRMVVEAAELDAGRDVVLEVGSGTGSLTRMLAERAAGVITVETDKTISTGTIDVVTTWRGDFQCLYASTEPCSAAHYNIDYDA